MQTYSSSSTSTIELLEHRQMFAAQSLAIVFGRVFEDLDLTGSYTQANLERNLGSDTGFVYADRNLNGRYEPDIDLFASISSGNPLVSSPADSGRGRYSFSLAPGSYLIRWSQTDFGSTSEVLPNLTPIVPNNREWWITVEAGRSYTYDFGFAIPSETAGRVYEDKNLSGKFDSGDVPLSGRYIYDDVNRNNRPDANEPFAWSDREGRWEIRGLKPFGHLIKHWYARSDWRGTVPNNDEWWYYFGSSGFGTNDFGVVRINASLTGASKGKITLPGVTPSVFKKGVKIFYDADGDGVLDKNEKVVTTDSQGRFDFKLGSKKLDVTKIRVLGAKP
jgi:hypothetical protein